MSIPADQAPPLSTDHVEALAAGDDAGALSSGLAAPTRRAPPCRVHGAHPERRRAARARSAGDASRTSPASSARSSSALVEESESHACGVWLLERGPVGAATCGWRYIGGSSTRRTAPAGTSLDAAAREHGRAPASPTRRAGPRPSNTPATTRGCPSRCASSIARTASTRCSSRRCALPSRNPRLDRAVHGHAAPTASGVAAGAARRDGPAGHAGAPSQPRRRSEPPRGAAPGGARGAQSHRARHPRHAGAGLRRHPDAAAGGAASAGDALPPAAAAQPRHRGRIWRART